MLGPGLLLLVVALQASARSPARWPQLAAIPVVLLSAAQIVRSAVLYVSAREVTIHSHNRQRPELQFRV